MGIVLSNLLVLFGKPAPKKVLMVGLDNAGKTTILYTFQAKGLASVKETTIPTVGFNVENIKVGSVTITVWDIGGQKKIRTLWSFYAESLSGLIYVIDIDDRERWGSAIEELKRILDKDKDVSGKKYPVLILANKIDKIEESKIEEVRDSLHSTLAPKSLFPGRAWRIVTCSAKMGGFEDITGGLMWLANNLIDPETGVY